MNKLIIDVETTIKNKGNPFTQSNTLVRVGLLVVDSVPLCLNPHEDKHIIQNHLDNADTLIGFNIKFDLHWLRKYGFNYSHCRVFDCQLAEFILGGQSEPYPSLNKTAERYGLGTKLDVVKTMYWEKGIDTTEIPLDILNEYLTIDLVLTNEVFKKQEPLINNGGFKAIFSLQCQDLLVLQEMEYNGTKFDSTTAERQAQLEEEKIRGLELELGKGYEDIPINWNSRDHLSCYLYGGTIQHEERIVAGVFKTGTKIGMPRYKLLKYDFTLPRLVEPPKGSELLKEGYYGTDEPTLRSIKTNKENTKKIESILERSQSNKLLGTYYRGIPELITEMEWPTDTVHGTFNQCVVATGRLSSSRPNLQNFAGSIKAILTTRYI